MSRRVRRIWLSLGATALSLLGLALVAIRVAQSRDTDLASSDDAVSSTSRHDIPAHAPRLVFRDVAEELGVRFEHGAGPRTRLLPEDTGSGAAWGDYDGDGDVDLYLVNFPGTVVSDPVVDSNRLFRNDGDRFTDVTEAAGVGDPGGFGMGASFADYDADGDLDLYVTNFGANRLFRNAGDGTFEDVAAAAGVADSSWSTGATWGDLDRDGHLDLYVCNYVAYDGQGRGAPAVPEWQGIPFTLNPNAYDPVPNRLFRNRGDGTFEDVAPSWGVDDAAGRSLAATICDLNGDGWLDIYVNNDVSQNTLFAGVGAAPLASGARFVEISAMTGTADPRGSMGLSVGDAAGPDGPTDGRPDLFITHWVAQENAFYIAVAVGEHELEFRDRVRQYKLGEISVDTVGWGTAFCDLDLDGRLDLAVANGSTLERAEDPSRLRSEPLFLFWRDETRFIDLAPAAGEAAAGRFDARGLAAADFDRDGDVDLVISVNRGRALVLRNETGTANRSVTVVLDGPDAARFGARIGLETSAGTQTRWWGADVSYLSMHGADAVFGLGTSTPRSVEVTWADGSVSRVECAGPGRIAVRWDGRRSGESNERSTTSGESHDQR